MDSYSFATGQKTLIKTGHLEPICYPKPFELLPFLGVFFEAEDLGHLSDNWQGRRPELTMFHPGDSGSIQPGQISQFLGTHFELSSVETEEFAKGGVFFLPGLHIVILYILHAM